MTRPNNRRRDQITDEWLDTVFEAAGLERSSVSSAPRNTGNHSAGPARNQVTGALSASLVVAREHHPRPDTAVSGAPWKVSDPEASSFDAAESNLPGASRRPSLSASVPAVQAPENEPWRDEPTDVLNSVPEGQRAPAAQPAAAQPAAAQPTAAPQAGTSEPASNSLFGPSLAARPLNDDSRPPSRPELGTSLAAPDLRNSPAPSADLRGAWRQHIETHAAAAVEELRSALTPTDHVLDEAGDPHDRTAVAEPEQEPALELELDRPAARRPAPASPPPRTAEAFFAPDSLLPAAPRPVTAAEFFGVPEAAPSAAAAARGNASTPRKSTKKPPTVAPEVARSAPVHASRPARPTVQPTQDSAGLRSVTDSVQALIDDSSLGASSANLSGSVLDFFGTSSSSAFAGSGLAEAPLAEARQRGLAGLHGQDRAQHPEIPAPELHLNESRAHESQAGASAFDTAFNSLIEAASLAPRGADTTNRYAVVPKRKKEKLPRKLRA